MFKVGFDNAAYLKMQSEKIAERIAKFGGKLYLEFGGKLFDDHHASRVLPGFAPDSKIRMLEKLKDKAEVIIAINAGDIEKNKVRGDLGITYDQDVLRLIDAFRGYGLYVSSVVLTRWQEQPSAIAYQKKLEGLGLKVYRHYPIAGYPSNIPLVVSDDGYGKNEFVETTRELVVVTAPGPGSGKMAVCLSQIYHENKRGVKAGYAKFETFPIWNIPLKHPVNLAYEAATADLNDVNMIDPFHLEAYGQTTINYNRDVEIFPVLNALFTRILGESPYKSPTDMGVNMAGNCIVDDDAVCEAARQEIIRRYYNTMCDVRKGNAEKDQIYKQELIMEQAQISTADRPVIAAAGKGRTDRRPGGRHPAERRSHHLGEDFFAARCFFRHAARRAQASREDSRRSASAFAHGHRADSELEDQAARAQEPASAHGRGPGGALRLCPHGLQRENRPREAAGTPPLRSAFQRHPLAGGCGCVPPPGC